jgi:hypothetical protein
MNEDASKPEDKPTPKPEKRREPYSPPDVASEDTFETLAISCSKDAGSQCDFTPPTSS